jgi:hypothetical protein
MMTSSTRGQLRLYAARARRQPLPGFAIGVATGIDLAAAALLVAGPVSWAVCGMALVLHLIATGSLMLCRRLRGRRRSLLLASSLALPVVGAAGVVLVLSRTERERSIAFERRLAGHRRALEVSPSHTRAMAAGAWIRHGIEVGLVDARRREAFAAEARRHFGLALTLAPPAAPEVALARARLELAVRRPDRALDLLDDALAAGTAPRHDELLRLRDEAARRSHDLPWEGRSLLATRLGGAPDAADEGSRRLTA